MIDTQIIETDMNKRMLNIDGANIDFELYTTKNSIIKLECGYVDAETYINTEQSLFRVRKILRTL